jgi:hypothetical protein
MRKEIDRFKSLTENINNILKEDKTVGHVPSEHTLPEAPATNPSDKKVNAPFTQTGVAKGDKDFKKEEHNHETAGGPFKMDGKSSVEKNMRSDKKPNVKTDAEYLTNEKTYEPDNNLASTHKKGPNPVGVYENKDNKIRLKLTEEQVLAWNDNKNYMDTSHGTQIGSSEPFEDELGEKSNQTEAPTEPIRESDGSSVVYDHPTDQNSPAPGTNEIGDGQPYDKEINEEAVSSDDIAGIDDDDNVPFPEVEDDDYGTRFDKEYADFERRMEPDYEIDIDDDSPYGGSISDLNIPDDMYDDDDESAYTYGYGDEGGEDVYDIELDEGKLNVWGKHPAYRKRPMTTPPNKEVAINGAREWDDESVQGEEPFGKQIGDSAPFDKIVNSVYESLARKIRTKKKV